MKHLWLVIALVFAVAPPAFARRRAASPPPVARVDLNHASAGEIARLPQIGPLLAARIVAVRRLVGPFVSLDELIDVTGMTERKLESIAPFVVLR